jgi:hypothetical protein
VASARAREMRRGTENLLLHFSRVSAKAVRVRSGCNFAAVKVEVILKMKRPFESVAEAAQLHFVVSATTASTSLGLGITGMTLDTQTCSRACHTMNDGGSQTTIRAYY